MHSRSPNGATTFPHLRAAAILVVASVLPASPAQADDLLESYELTAVIRDFKGSDEPGGHPDMERNKAIGGGGIMVDVVMPTLGSDGRPAWQGLGRRILYQKIGGSGPKIFHQTLDLNGNPICYTMYDSGLGDTPYTLDPDLGQPSGFTNKANFDEWYRDVPGVNLSTTIMLTVQFDAVDGLYRYSDEDNFPDGYFPIDGQLFGNSAANPAHNYHFTTQLKGRFTYDGTAGQMFKYKGDDDVWVFVNGQLVIDLAGTHYPDEQYIHMDRLGLSDGDEYTLDFFHAERQTNGSRFEFTTNFKMVDGFRPTIDLIYD